MCWEGKKRFLYPIRVSFWDPMAKPTKDRLAEERHTIFVYIYVH